MTTLARLRPGREAWIERVGRLGFTGRGAVYALVAVIAIKVALGGGGQPEDQRGALMAVRDEAFGLVLLVSVALGLAGYGTWWLVDAVRGPDGDSGWKQWGERGVSAGKGVLYAVLALYAWLIVFRVGGGGSSEREQTALALGWPGGVAVVTAVGAALVGVAAYQLYRAASRSFLDDLALPKGGLGERLAVVAGVAGHAGRAVVFSLMGVFLGKAALEHRPREAKGLDGALKELAQQAYGRYLLGLVAAALLLFALFCFIEARYRRL
jgi:hypothetical protein